MKKIISILILFCIIISFYNFFVNEKVIIQQVKLDGNNINAWFINSGIFNQDKRYNNVPGFEWPKGTNKFAMCSAGFCCSAFIQGELRQFMGSYAGELAPGYIIDSAGVPKAKTDFRFKIWNVIRTDNHINNPDWLNWGIMVPYGAPFIDVNQNNIFDPLVDTPGVKGAVQTLFACLTDGFPEEHKLGEGFGGGTLPMFAEVRLTAWCYDITALQNVQYIKWQVINKNKISWDSTYFAIVSDPDIGNATDDYIGCDTLRRLGFCYNGDNDDEQFNNTYNYGLNPPSVGFKFLRTAINNLNFQYGMTSFVYFNRTSSGGPPCETASNGEPLPSYYYMTGIKKDRTPWVVPPGGNTSLISKYVYSGDPESGQGWNEGIPGNPSGSVGNCGGPTSLNGVIYPVNTPYDRRMVIGSGSKFLKVNPGDTQVLVAAQLIARGSNNLNSVTKLKQLSDTAQNFYDTQFPIGVNNISSSIPSEYKLYQNFPNPFNPTTKIKFSLPNPSKGGAAEVCLKIYDVSGKEIANLIPPLRGGQEGLGTYSVDWVGSNFSSGIYFYSLIIDGNVIDTKKMVLLK